MTPHTLPDTRSSRDATALAAISSAALQVIAAMPGEEMVGAVTPERIGKLAGYSASSVRYQLARARRTAAARGDDTGSRPARGWAFDREFLWLTLIDDISRRILETTHELAGVYSAALEAYQQTGDLDPLKAAVIADLDAYSPGASDASTELSERAYLVALATCDDSPKVARMIRATKDAEMEIYAEVYRAWLPAVGRRPTPGSTHSSIAHDLAMLFEGASLRRRYDPSFAPEEIFRPLQALLRSLTEPIAGGEQSEGADALRRPAPLPH